MGKLAARVSTDSTKGRNLFYNEQKSGAHAVEEAASSKRGIWRAFAVKTQRHQTFLADFKACPSSAINVSWPPSSLPTVGKHTKLQAPLEFVGFISPDQSLEPDPFAELLKMQHIPTLVRPKSMIQLELILKVITRVYMVSLRPIY